MIAHERVKPLLCIIIKMEKYKAKKINEFETRKSAHLGILGVCKECRNAPRRQQR